MADMADAKHEGRSGIKYAPNVRPNPGLPGRQSVKSRPAAISTVSKTNQPESSGSISTHYKEFAGKDEYGYVKQRSNQVVQPAIDTPERPKTGHKSRENPPIKPQGAGQTIQQPQVAAATNTKQNVSVRTSHAIGQNTQHAPRTNVQSKANILTLTNNRSTSNSSPVKTYKSGPQKPTTSVPTVATHVQKSGHAPPQRRLSQDSVTSSVTSFPGRASEMLPNQLEQSWDMMEVSKNDNQESVQADTEMDGRPRTSRGRHRRPPDQAKVEAKVEPPDPPLVFTEPPDMPERPKTSHGRRQRQEVHQETMSPPDGGFAPVSQFVNQPVGPSPPPYPPPTKRQNSANRKLSSASRKSSTDATAGDIVHVVQHMPDVRPISATLQKYKRLPSIGDKTASDKLIGLNEDLKRISVDNKPAQVLQVESIKQDLHRHYTPPQVLTLAEMDQDTGTVDQLPIQSMSGFSTSPLPGEPTEGERILLAIRLPCGERLQRYFRISDTLSVVLKFAEETAGKKFTGYTFVCSVPKQVFKDMGQQIKKTGLQDRTVLLLQAPD